MNKEDGSDLLYLQVAAQIRRAIADGEAKPGERLPPARDLATVLGVNTNTVLRSLRLLQDEGLLELRRRRGITVAGTPERGAVMQKVRELVEFARAQGYAVDELVEMIEDVDKPEPRTPSNGRTNPPNCLVEVGLQEGPAQVRRIL